MIVCVLCECAVVRISDNKLENILFGECGGSYKSQSQAKVCEVDHSLRFPSDSDPSDSVKS